jgi:hypothetical protein
MDILHEYIKYTVASIIIVIVLWALFPKWRKAIALFVAIPGVPPF